MWKCNTTTTVAININSLSFRATTHLAEWMNCTWTKQSRSLNSSFAKMLGANRSWTRIWSVAESSLSGRHKKSSVLVCSLCQMRENRASMSLCSRPVYKEILTSDKQFFYLKHESILTLNSHIKNYFTDAVFFSLSGRCNWLCASHSPLSSLCRFERWVEFNLSYLSLIKFFEWIDVVSCNDRQGWLKTVSKSLEQEINIKSVDNYLAVMFQRAGLKFWIIAPDRLIC